MHSFRVFCSESNLEESQPDPLLLLDLQVKVREYVVVASHDGVGLEIQTKLDRRVPELLFLTLASFDVEL